MLGEFKCDQHVFVYLFRKSLFFDINDSTEILSTQMRSFFANLFQNSIWKSRARRYIIIFMVNLVIFPKIRTFQVLNLLEAII